MSKVQLRSEIIKAHCNGQSSGEISLEKLVYPNIYIPNRGLAMSLSFKDDNDEMILKIKNDIEEYNIYIDFIFGIPGFWDKFKSNGYFIAREECEEMLGVEKTNEIFSLKRYQFYTSLCMNDGWLFLRENVWKYFVEAENNRIEFEIEETDKGYPKKIKSDKRKYDLLWNWYEDERDFCYYLWEKLDSKGLIINSEEDDEPIKSYSHFECYDQGRDCMDFPDPNLMKIFKLLQDMGYLSIYYIEADNENPIWQLRSAPDGRIGLMLLDNSFEKNPLLMEKIKIILNCSEADVDDFMLTDEEGHQYQSKQKGSFGGHNKLKIYGRMDCPSANRYVMAGQYVQHRVFFADENTAVKAGYRPCGKCMPAAYKKWKELNGEKK